MKITKERLKEIIKEELGKAISETEMIPDVTGFFSGPGFDDEEQEEEKEERSPGNIQRMRERAIEIINEMSPNELVQLLQQINPET